MDIATILGLVGGMAVVIFGAMQGGSIGGLIDIGSVFITIFGSYFCMFTNYPLRYCLGVFKVMGLTFKVPDLQKFEFSKKTGGENIDDVIRRAIRFKTKGKKIYVYEEEKEDAK